MCDAMRIACFTREITDNGILAQMLDHLPLSAVLPALAALARDGGYTVRTADLRAFLAGFDARFAWMAPTGEGGPPGGAETRPQ